MHRNSSSDDPLDVGAARRFGVRLALACVILLQLAPLPLPLQPLNMTKEAYIVPTHFSSEHSVYSSN